jgi:NAD(P)-dependent dehydrogenase (short-subunit alcohol dehydrogenase family)
MVDRPADQVGKAPLALVTGGARGIGLAVCSGLLRAGYAVTAASRTLADLRAAETSISDPRFRAEELDARHEPSVERIIRSLSARGELMAVVAAHGVYPDATPVAETSLAGFRDVIDINLVGTFLVARAAARAMQDGGHGGTIILFGSANGFAAEAGMAAYNASKAALHSLAQTLAVELAPKGIRAVAVAPGWVRTPMTDEYITPEMTSGRVRYNAQARVAEPAEVAALVTWLCSDAASYVTGCTIPIDGGQMSEAPGPWLL